MKKITYNLHKLEILEIDPRTRKGSIVVQKENMQFHIIQKIIGKLLTSNNKEYLITITPVEHEI